MPSDDTIQEQAYLVSKGVRPLALVDSTSLDPAEMEESLLRLTQVGAYRSGRGPVIPFVLPREDKGRAMTGFASHQWVVDLLRWSCASAPLRQHHQIVGLLLGYAPDAIGEHDAMEFVERPTGRSTSK